MRFIVYSCCVFVFLVLLACNPNETGTSIPNMVLVNGDQRHQITSFYIDIHEVTNADFLIFVEATGYNTIAEQEIDWEEMKEQLPPDTPQMHDSLMAPGSLVFRPTNQPVNLHDHSQWWEWVRGATWRHPAGPESDINNKDDHPVVHLAYTDAEVYCKWKGKRLPTESEWMWAGNERNISYHESTLPEANLYQGLFPYQNTVQDGYEHASPVKSYPPNALGLYDMAGNVWEWCSDIHPSDRYQRVMKGGSYLCNAQYCAGYNTSQQMWTTEDSAMSHLGCRCVK